MTKTEIRKFQKKLFSWWKTNARDLPWRHTHDPYHIMVSEIMLQQTQVSRVLESYRVFIQKYPDIQSLASAPLSDVLRAWKGLGYNRRAKYLHDVAKTVIKNYHGVFPNSESDLRELPGIGLYTARAILVFAFKKNVAMVDTNVRRIITEYIYNGKEQSEKEIQNAADMLLPKGKSWEWHQALMDYGALALKKRSISPTKQRKKSVPFRESNRFIRGKIMDILREKPISKEMLIHATMTDYAQNQNTVEHIIAGMEKEGLLTVSKKGTIRLPD